MDFIPPLSCPKDAPLQLADNLDNHLQLSLMDMVSVDNRIHSTRLKMRLLASFPDLTAHTEGRDILLTFDRHLGGALRKACDHDGEALYLARAAQIVRREIFFQWIISEGLSTRGHPKLSACPREHDTRRAKHCTPDIVGYLAKYKT